MHVVRYKLVSTNLGRALVAESSRPDPAVCYISFPGLGDEASALNGLRKIYATVEECDSLHQEDLIVSVLDGEDVANKLVVALDGADFSVSVWRQLMRIPFGEVATYAEVAQAIGRPTAARAVAMACSRNHIAVLVPCHRVVASNGSLSGFGWGVENKKMLLEREGVTKFSA